MAVNRTDLFMSHLSYKEVGTVSEREQLKKKMHDARASLPDSIRNSNVGCWRNEVQYPDAEWLIGGLHEMIEEAIEFYKEADPTFARAIQKNQISLQSWSNINEPGSFNALHSHPESTFACVYYVQAEGTGALKFPNPVNLLNNYYTVSPYMRGIVFEPKDGELVLFPGWLPHEVGINTSDKQRMNIAFQVTVS